GAWSHFLSTAPAWQVHGSSCGPENTGPLLGWLVRVMRVAQLPGTRASSTFDPILSPVTRPSYRPSERLPNSRVTFRFPSVTLTCLRSTRGRLIATSDVPPLTRLARPERTEIDRAGRFAFLRRCFFFL